MLLIQTKIGILILLIQLCPINTSVGDAQQRLADVSFTSSDDQGVLKDTVLNIYISISKGSNVNQSHFSNRRKQLGRLL